MEEQNSMDQETEDPLSGFKRLTIENWHEPDIIMDGFVMFDPDQGALRKMTGDDWANQFLPQVLPPQVPSEIRQLFEITKSALLYGYFFYPLYSLGIQQMTRVMEAAASSRCQIEGAPPGANGFRNSVNWLAKKGIIADKQKWEAMVELRNISSHPREMFIVPPGDVAGMLSSMVDDISALFP